MVIVIFMKRRNKLKFLKENFVVDFYCWFFLYIGVRM